MWIYSCCHAAIPATMWLFLLPCSYFCHHVAILAAMPLFLPSCGYSCYPAAVIPAICGFTCFYSFQFHHLVVLVSRPFLLSCIQLFLLPCSYIPYPRVAKLPCECSGFIPRARPFYCSRFTAPRCLYCFISESCQLYSS